ncbi:MAG: hypothetical protein WCK18_08435 [Prolixibacteraceae bacterium]
MKKLLLFAFLLTVVAFSSMAQKETTKLKAQKDTVAAVDLLGEMNSTTQEKPKLLPDKILFTQRIFWGEKGLMRNFNAFELTPEKRQNELKVRRTMLVMHQIMGTLTLGGMIGQGIVGAKLYNASGSNYRSLKNTHETLAGVVNFTYFSTAALSLFAPPKMLNEHKGYSSIKVHRALAIVHLSAMIATNILASQLNGPNGATIRPYHRAAAFTAFGAFAASMIVIKF